MLSKIALGTALVVASVSGALAWDNVGEIANPQDPAVVQTWSGYNAYGAVHRGHAMAQPRPDTRSNPSAYDPGDVANQ